MFLSVKDNLNADDKTVLKRSAEDRSGVWMTQESRVKIVWYGARVGVSCFGTSWGLLCLMPHRGLSWFSAARVFHGLMPQGTFLVCAARDFLASRDFLGTVPHGTF